MIIWLPASPFPTGHDSNDIAIGDLRLCWQRCSQSRKAFRLCESSLAVAKQDGHIVALLIGNNNIGFAVIIEISDLDASRRSSDRKV